jgi:molecular chaperone GrpE (heat shock protein)
MSPEERFARIEAALDRLTERHEALAQSMELARHDQQQDAEAIHQLVIIARDALTSIQSLERTATAHEGRLDDHGKRIDRLEDNA